MKHPLFKHLGDDYPFSLEESYDRILCRIEELWDSATINDYFSDLLIDKRGGRKGFPARVLEDIIKLREFRELETLRKAEDKHDAINELKLRGIDFNKEQFFQSLNMGDKAKIDLFVRASFNINITDEDGVPPILIALKKGYTVVTQILLNAGADVNAKGKDGLTPLLIACGKPTYGYKAIAETLIKKGALINTRDMLGYTPLLLSLSGGTVEIAELLIERGADITATTRNGESAMSLATQLENHKIIDLLARKAAQKL
ncbi:MAG TPA: ankyrin repeat domain-containing protein [Methylophilaceae bacterium]|nr:ankyrin repeat domain-containing protein [Methylophilaceae bacterium]